jgi:hypothetical protein
LPEQPVGDLAGPRRRRQVGRQRLQAVVRARAHGLLGDPEQRSQLGVRAAAEDQLDGGPLVRGKALKRVDGTRRHGRN